MACLHVDESDLLARRALSRRRYGRGSNVRSDGRDDLAGARRRPVRIGLLVPLSGPAGIWGPSSQASAQLAVQELNQQGGILGREVELVLCDAGQAPEDMADDAEALLYEAGIDAIVGMHISAVRQAVVRRIGGTVPYVYTPLYEGGERSPGVFAIGETPDQQLRPALHWLAEHRGAERWALVGNDYVWPRVSNRLARRYITESGGQLIDETYVPLGHDDFGPQIERLRRAGVDAVLLSLIGDDAVLFNRQFAEAGLAGAVLRLSPAVEENSLLAIGEAGTEQLYVSTGYLGSMATPANGALLEQYHGVFGAQAPLLNGLGESCFEGFRFLSAAAAKAESLDVRAVARASDGLTYQGPRGRMRMRRNRVDMPIYLAEARGYELQACASFAPDGRVASV